jgi:hypothetical protein
VGDLWYVQFGVSHHGHSDDGWYICLNLMIDTLGHIRQQNTYQQELWRIAVNAAAAEDATTTQGLL